jgi:hypothetical protein
MTRQTDIADTLERLAKLEAAEQERQRLAEEERAAQKQLEEMRPDKIPNVRITATSEGEGILKCWNEDCTDAYKPAGKVKMRSETVTRFLRDASGGVTDNPENDWTHHHILEPELLPCPTCGETRQALPPGTTDAWEGQKRRLKTTWGAPNTPAEREAKAWNEHLKAVEDANRAVQDAVKES